MSKILIAFILTSYNHVGTAEDYEITVESVEIVQTFKECTDKMEKYRLEDPLFLVQTPSCEFATEELLSIAGEIVTH